MNGKGTIYYNNKKIKYSGIFVNNCLEGEGIFYDIDGNYYRILRILTPENSKRVKTT